MATTKKRRQELSGKQLMHGLAAAAKLAAAALVTHRLMNEPALLHFLSSRECLDAFEDYKRRRKAEKELGR